MKIVNYKCVCSFLESIRDTGQASKVQSAADETDRGFAEEGRWVYKQPEGYTREE